MAFKPVLAHASCASTLLALVKSVKTNLHTCVSGIMVSS